MRRLFRGALGLLAAAGGFLGLNTGARTTQQVVQQSAPATAPIPGAYDATEQIPIARTNVRLANESQIRFIRHWLGGRPPIWVGRPRSKHGRQYGPWGRV